MEQSISGAPVRSPSAASFVRPSLALARRFAALTAKTDVPFRVIMSNGTVIQSHGGPPAFTLTFRSRAAERRAVLFGYVGLLESYFDGNLDIEGNLALAFRAGYEGGFDQTQTPLVRLRSQWFERRYSNRSLAQAKVNARFHYGRGQEFYRPWLDHPSMMYTCAYWKEGTKTLEEAQRNKMDHVCRKVQLKAGETFVDVGSGWGGLLFHAWDRYGALGTGINTTTEQVKETQAEVKRRGLADKIRVIECDFREIPGRYDKLLSIGTLEHAGPAQLHQVVRAHADALKPGGLGVIHFIGHVGERDTELFIRKYIFPGGWIPSLSTAIASMERCGLEILDIENLRRHYALTLDVWAERFDRNWDAIQSLDPQRFDERMRRIWRTYLWSCAEAFRTKTPDLNLFQVTVSKNSVGGSYPMSRSFLYNK
jgi:cyclopropane-fatty-acyl-phospholipid synthase